jgi:hypothetical protein
MKGVPPKIANTLWQTFSTFSWYRFRRAYARLEEVQSRILRHYLITNRNTDYGRRHDFKSIQTVDEFREKVPLSNYEDYAESIEAIAQGQSMVLTAEPVLMFEITSGSASASKLIPFTQSLRSEFQRAISVWIVDIFRNNPALKNGPAYWSITPLVEGQTVTSAGIPIGFEEDSAYLGRWGKYFVDAAMAVPEAIKHIGDIETFRYTTLLFLLRQPHLRIISIWNPTFLTLLLEHLPEYWQNLITDIAEGTISPPGVLDRGLRHTLLKQLPPDPDRSNTLASIHPDDYQSFWPDLGLIGCWMDAAARPEAEALQTRFPKVAFQGKGLIATEAFVSFPIMGLQGNVLASTSHFFEFLPTDPQTFSPTTTQTKLAHQLEKDQTYAVIVTTGGGLYRYQMHDVVQVVDHVFQTPCLRFLGKGDKVSDWFGEKLNEQFVSAILADLMRESNLSPKFSMLAPDDDGKEFRYTLYLELPPFQRTREFHPGFSSRLDRKLRHNFHYDYCRKLGQLAAPELFLIDHGAAEAFIQACQSQGQRLGNIKPTSLQKTTGWGNVFSQRVL